jgi:hypothetical protein
VNAARFNRILYSIHKRAADNDAPRHTLEGCPRPVYGAAGGKRAQLTSGFPVAIAQISLKQNISISGRDGAADGHGALTDPIEERLGLACPAMPS